MAIFNRLITFVLDYHSRSTFEKQERVRSGLMTSG